MENSGDKLLIMKGVASVTHSINRISHRDRDVEAILISGDEIYSRLKMRTDVFLFLTF